MKVDLKDRHSKASNLSNDVLQEQPQGHKEKLKKGQSQSQSRLVAADPMSAKDTEGKGLVLDRYDTGNLSRVRRGVRRLSQQLGLKIRKNDPVSQFCRKVNRNNHFQGVMFVALLGALFLPDIWILADFEDNYICDILLTVILMTFLFEFAIQCIGLKRSYLWTFFSTWISSGIYHCFSTSRMFSRYSNLE